MSTAEYFEDINDDIVGANEKTSMTHQPKPEVKCEKQCKVLECENGVFGMYHLKCNCECHDTPASTEVKCEHTKGFKCNLCRDTQIANNDFKSSPASTEEWSEIDEYFVGAEFGLSVSKIDDIKSFIRSHDQQLRQRIDKELFEELAMDDPECEHGHFWQDCTAKKCDKRSMALLYKHLATFITNLK